MNGYVAQAFQDETRVRLGQAFTGAFSYTTAGVAAGNIGLKSNINVPGQTVITSIIVASSVAQAALRLISNAGTSTLTDQGAGVNRLIGATASTDHLFSGDLTLAGTLLKLFNVQANVGIQLLAPGEVFVVGFTAYVGIQSTIAAQTLTLEMAWYELPN